jgi:hypothetical protein
MGLVGNNASLIGATVRGFGAGEIAARFEQGTKIEGTGRVTPVIGAAVGVLCGHAIASVFEEHPEIARGGGVSQPIGQPEGRLRGIEATLLCERHAAIERSFRFNRHGRGGHRGNLLAALAGLWHTDRLSRT